MEIKVKTIYGNVTVKTIYNYDDSDRIISYSAYDDNGKYLGDLSCVHEIYEVDDKTLGLLAELVEDAIEANDICVPLLKEDTDKIVYVITILETNNGCSTAESRVYKSIEQCIDEKMKRLDEFYNDCEKSDTSYDAHDDGTICQVFTDNKSRYLCITIKCTPIL